jgi:hypothetical protein
VPVTTDESFDMTENSMNKLLFTHSL